MTPATRTSCSRTAVGLRRRDGIVSPTVAVAERGAAGRAIEALGDPTRRAIFELLADRPQPVRELADVLPISRPAVSQHLKVMKDAGLVVDRPEGTRRVYRVDPSAVAAMRDYLDRMWDTALRRFAAAAEADDTGPRKERRR
jgi:DNA-binding transcriptional ArsR family regulator